MKEKIKKTLFLFIIGIGFVSCSKCQDCTCSESTVIEDVVSPVDQRKVPPAFEVADLIGTRCPPTAGLHVPRIRRTPVLWDTKSASQFDANLIQQRPAGVTSEGGSLHPPTAAPEA